MDEKNTYLSRNDHNILVHNIKMYRKQNGLTQKELSSKIGVSDKTYSRWENGDVSPGMNKIIDLCRVLGITINQLLEGTSILNAVSEEEQDLICSFRRFDIKLQNVVRSFISQLNTAIKEDKKQSSTSVINFQQFYTPASAGSGSIMDGNEASEWVSVYKRDEIADADMLIKISGDSMNPTFKSGQSVYVKKTSEIYNGEIGVFIVNGESYIKEKGADCLISHNEDYENIPLSENDCIVIVGKVIGTLRQEDIAE